MTYETSSIWWLIWKAQGEACFSCWYIPLSGWLALLLDGGPYPLAYHPRNTVVILTSQSLFSNYFTHYGTQPHPVRSVSGININLNAYKRVGIAKLCYAHCKDKVESNHNLYFEAMHFLLYLIRGIVATMPLLTLVAIREIYFWLTRNTFSFTATQTFPPSQKQSSKCSSNTLMTIINRAVLLNNLCIT